MLTRCLLATFLATALPLSAADSITVVNPSFQTDVFGTFPGYLGGANPAGITGWTGGGGINGSDIGAGTAFANNGAIPDGTRVAFIQGAGSLSQALGGLEVGQRYWVQVWTNARDCCGDFPQLSVTMAGQPLLAPTVIGAVGGTSPYTLANFEWVATAASATLAINSAAAAGGDASAVFDAVAVIKRSAAEVLLANPSFEASGSIAYPGYYANIAGWAATAGPGSVGLNTVAGPFANNGTIPDGASVLLLQNTAKVEQAVTGLAPGGSYRLTLRYNARSGSGLPRFRVRIAGQLARDADVSPVGAGQPYHTFTFDFTAATESTLLVLENAGINGDTTALVDNVSLALLSPPATPALALPQPGKAGAAGGIITFNEIHYNPAGIGAPEWVELVNQFGSRLDLGGWQITGGVNFTIPEGTMLEPGAFLVVSSAAGNPAGALGPWAGLLDGNGETIRLRTRQGWLVDEVEYGVTGDWPTAPDGTGPTLAKRGASLASDQSDSWTASTLPGGTPGAANFPTMPQLAAPPAHVAGSVVISEILYHARPNYADGAVPYSENAREFVELHNRSGAPVALAGWRLDDAVEFTFPAGTTLAAGGFLAITDAQFSGSLNNTADSVKLRAAGGALVDKVRYRDGGRWPAVADGGGASLELRDVDADNTLPEAWAASDESAKMPWQNYSYTALGAEPPGSNNPATWREFLVGLLDAGEVLIDDLSVREDPAGANIEVIQNGTFEADTLGQPPQKWRCLGTHKLSTVVQDPHGPGKVLRIVATGPPEHTYNTCSTTLVGNRVIDATKNYTVSFRAKWTAGSPQLNTRLYLNRAARTTILPQPAVTATGTPGAANSRAIANAGPTFTDLVHTPLTPAPGQPVTVFARPADPDGLGAVTLFYSVNAGAFTAVAMTADGAGRYSGIIPAQPMTNRTVEFYVQAADGAGATATFPSGGSRALFKTGDGGATLSGLANRIRLIMRPDEAAAMHQPLHAVSNHRWPATVIFNDSEVFYDVRVRLRSSPYGRQGNRTGWNLDFDPEQPFRGTETDMVLDGAFNMPRGDGGGWLENTTSASVNELLFQRIAERGGGVPAEIDDVVFVATPYYENRRAQMRLRRYTNTALDEFTDNGGDGSLYKQEIIYYPTATVDGNPESLKNPYTTWTAVDTLTMGADKEAYRHNYLVQNHRDRDSYAGIIAMCAAFSSANPVLYDNCAAALDLDNWARVLALNALTGLADTFNQHLTHNMQFLARPGDGRVMLLPWDMDHALYFATNFSIYGGAAHRVRDLIADARMKRLVAQHHLDFCNTSFTAAYLNPWVDHYSALAARPQYATTLKTWIANRRASVLAQINTDWPATAFAITTNSGNNFSVAAAQTTLAGAGWVDVAAVRIAGAPEPLAVTWTSGTAWQANVPLTAGANALTLEALNRQGAVVGSDTITITNTSGIIPAAAGNLVVSEIFYNPPGAVELGEWLELLNISANTVSLAGAHFDEEDNQGIAYTFAAGTQLAAGARIVVARDRETFLAEHPGFAGNLAAGEFDPTALDNSGESIVLYNSGGAEILRFTYADALADGNGHSLVRVLSSTTPNAAAYEWRESTTTGGNPGTSDATPFTGTPSADADADGLAALLEYALARSDTAPGGAAFTLARDVSGNLLVTLTRATNADDATLTIESAPAPNGPWATAAATLQTATVAGTASTDTWLITPPPATTQFFMRLKAAVR